ncbi:MAG: hypothetical protein ACR2PG_24955 [Hyphomicrobiaceae bacterium]
MLSLLGKVLRILAGFAVAIVVASTVHVMFVIFPIGLNELIGTDWTKFRTWLLWIVETSLFYGAFAFLPAAAFIIASEVISIRSLTYYLLAGLTIAVGGFAYLARTSAAAPSFVVAFTVAAFLISGIAAGLAYWLISGQFAGVRLSGRKTKS